MPIFCKRKEDRCVCPTLYKSMNIVVDLSLLRSGSVFRVRLITRQGRCSHAVTLGQSTRGFHNDVFLLYILLLNAIFPLCPGLLAKGYVCFIWMYLLWLTFAAYSANFVQTLHRLHIYINIFYIYITNRTLIVVSFCSQPGWQQWSCELFCLELAFRPITG